MIMIPTYTYLPTYHLPTHLPTYLPAYLPACLPACLPAYLPTHLRQSDRGFKKRSHQFFNVVEYRRL